MASETIAILIMFVLITCLESDLNKVQEVMDQLSSLILNKNNSEASFLTHEQQKLIK